MPESEQITAEQGMFFYAFSISGGWNDYEDIRVVADRAEALMYFIVLGLRPRVVAR